MNKIFLPPVIYSANEDLSKRWNITYSIFNQNTEKFDRFQDWISSSKFPTRTARHREARRLKREILRSLTEGDHFRFSQVEYMSVQPVLVMSIYWLKQYRDEESTLKTYNCPFIHLKKYLKWKRLAGILPLDFNSRIARGYYDFLMSRKISNRTINHYIATVRRFFDFLKVEDIIKMNPFRNFKRLKVAEVPVRRYSQEQTVRIMEVLRSENPNLYCYSMLVYYTFMRLKEVRHLQVKHFDLKERVINVSSVVVKNNKYKNPRISDALLPAVMLLNLNGNPDRYVFSRTGIKPPARGYMSAKFRKLFPASWTVYRLKHTGMQDHHNAGVPIQDIQAQGAITEQVMRKHYLEAEKRQVSDAILTLAPVIGKAENKAWRSVLAQLRSLPVEDQNVVKEKMGW